jgi:hypothetical protein
VRSASPPTSDIVGKDHHVGTGIPAGTTIISQTSGTPGAAGVYVFSTAVNLSSISCSASSCAITNIELNGAKIDCSAIGNVGAGQVVNAKDVTLNDLQHVSPFSYHLSITGSSNVWVNRPKFDTANGSAVSSVFAGLAGTTNCANVFVLDGILTGAGSHAIVFQNVAGGRIAGNTITGAAGSGVYLDAAANIGVESNIFATLSAVAVVEFGATNYNRISHNDFSQTSNGAITITGAGSIIGPGNIGYTHQIRYSTTDITITWL